jgi:hypothetical protein
MTIRSEQKWADLGSEGAVADIARNVSPATSEAMVRDALAYTHCSDLDDASITGQTVDEREVAISALTRGYLDTYRASGKTAVAA